LKWTNITVEGNETPFRRYGHSVVAHGTNIYLWGGCNEDIYDADLYCFDTSMLKHDWKMG